MSKTEAHYIMPASCRLGQRPEIIWSNKETRVKRISLPFQPVEILTESRILKHFRSDRWIEGVDWPKNYPKNWKNRLIWGDNKYIMSSLLRQGFAGKINLIYIDPPFATGADFRVPVQIGKIETVKEPSVIEKLAYRDTWGKGLSSYLHMMYERLVLMKELLSETGSIYVHQDYRAVHCIKLIMDEIFGRENMINEVIWAYRIQGITKRAWARKHDTLLFYAKDKEKYYFGPQQERVYYEKPFFSPEVDEQGRYYRDVYIRDVWDHDDTKPIISGSREYLHFPTQKSEGLLRRVINASSKEGDILADFFCGSGTAGATAEKLGRRWIMADISKFAIHTCRKRLLGIHEDFSGYQKPCRPFVIQNLGSYQKYKFIENGHPPVEEYRKFVLELYDAKPINGYSFIHGSKAKRFVHIAGVDSVVTINEVKDAADECANRIGGRALDVLGWDFELGLDKAVSDVEEIYGIDAHLKYIPREATELKEVAEAGEDVKFFDLSYLEVEPVIHGKRLKVELKNFAFANPEYIPKEIRKKVKDFTDYIDYWAVDFDYRNDVFHNMWQSFRTPNDQALETVATHSYKTEGEKQVFVKVIDVFGNDANSLFEVLI